MKRSRILALAAVAVMLAAVSILYQPPTPGESQTLPPINLAGKVDAASCQPCHLQLGETDVKGLVFSHGAHLIYDCESCHYQSAHEGGGARRPPMQACFNCHGMNHPQGTLASRKCSDCHTSRWRLRPKTHVKDWAEKPHVESAKADLNSCMMCHSAPEDCDECHKEQGVDVGPMPPLYNPILPEKVEGPAVVIYPDQPATIGQCVHCHSDLDDFSRATRARLIFGHDEHLKRNYDCPSCHPTFAHAQESIIKPPMQVCYRCHGLVHAAQGLVAEEKCGKCHPKRFDLKPPDHTKAFEAKAHGKAANRDGSYCAMCHKSDFCIGCHQGRKANKSGKKEKVVPADHKKAEWKRDHGGLYLKQEGSCASCHDSDSCKVCHKTVMPHPTDWLTTHMGREGKTDLSKETRDDCNVCHTDREKCQQCHHDQVKARQLVKSACIGCHEEMKTVPATNIKHKGFAEHAVHFNVEKSKGRPYICEDCHIGFGTAKMSVAQLQQGHDLRLCYECHGALDYRNRQIAPYTGAELCLRCHSDLNI